MKLSLWYEGHIANYTPKKDLISWHGKILGWFYYTENSDNMHRTYGNMDLLKVNSSVQNRKTSGDKDIRQIQPNIYNIKLIHIL